jgi:hypothetical protein
MDAVLARVRIGRGKDGGQANDARDGAKATAREPELELGLERALEGRSGLGGAHYSQGGLVLGVAPVGEGVDLFRSLLDRAAL